MPIRVHGRTAAVGVVLLACVACATSQGSAPRSTFTPLNGPTTPLPSTPAPAAPEDCGSYAAPDPDRPVLSLDLTVTGRMVTGREQVRFIPDQPITELVFRLWAGAPRAAAAGGSADVSSLRIDGAPHRFVRTSPTLVEVPWRGAKGVPLTVDLDFSEVLPTGADERLGNRGSTSWLGSGFPLLAWERGRGWAKEPATAAFAEASTSEDMQLARLTVRHDVGLSVIATGGIVSESPTATVTSALAVRDVAVAVGAFRVVTLDVPNRVQVGVDPTLPDDPHAVAAELTRALAAHAQRFGPYPYDRLAVAVLPDIRGGIEYPGTILLGSRQDKDATASHEVAHQWFYGLVGDDQARDPWLDEGFATYAEAVDRRSGASYRAVTIPADGVGKAGHPMTFWAGRPSYFRSVYLQTAVALLKARSLDPQGFDAQVRCYVAHLAHRIATPADVAREIPLAVPALTHAGALRGVSAR